MQNIMHIYIGRNRGISRNATDQTEFKCKAKVTSCGEEGNMRKGLVGQQLSSNKSTPEATSWLNIMDSRTLPCFINPNPTYSSWYL